MMRKNEKDSKTKEDIMIQNLREDLNNTQSDLNFINNFIDRIMKAMVNNSMGDDL